MQKRFAIRIDPAWAPLLLAGGATRGNSYVDVTDSSVTFRMGPIFRYTISRDSIAEVREIKWSFWPGGIGWRVILPGRIGLLGSVQGVVEVRLKDTPRLLGLLPVHRVVVSLQEPAAFVQALQPEPAEAPAAARAPRARRTPRPDGRPSGRKRSA